MSSHCTILFMAGILLSSGSSVTVASDENPWSMEEFDDGRQSYYDLNGGAHNGPFYQGGVNSPNEGAVPGKLSPQGRGGAVHGSGKGRRNEIFGYAGPQPKTGRRLKAQEGFGQFGTFPPAGGQFKRKRKQGAFVGSNGGVRYGGRSFGAFPPKEKRAAAQESTRARDVYGYGHRVPQQPSSAFANVPPVPVPDPIPERAYPYPYSGYAGVPGYGTGYGTGIAPGLGGYGLGAGPGFGSPLASPGLPGFAMPGFMW